MKLLLWIPKKSQEVIVLLYITHNAIQALNDILGGNQIT